MKRRTFLGGLFTTVAAAFSLKPAQPEPVTPSYEVEAAPYMPDTRVNWNSHPQPGVYRSQPFTPTGPGRVYWSEDDGVTWTEIGDDPNIGIHIG